MIVLIYKLLKRAFFAGNFTSAEKSSGLSNVWKCGAVCFDRFLMMHVLVVRVTISSKNGCSLQLVYI